jgi:hypothetical protein
LTTKKFFTRPAAITPAVQATALINTWFPKNSRMPLRVGIWALRTTRTQHSKTSAMACRMARWIPSLRLQRIAARFAAQTP